MSNRFSDATILLGLSIVLSLGCGGGGGSDGGNAVKPPATISVSPSTSTLAIGGSLRLTATGTNFGSAHWSVLESGGGGLSPQGNEALYFAPAIPGTYHVVVKGDDPNVQASSELKVLESLDYLSLVMTPHIIHVQLFPAGPIQPLTQAQARIQTVRGGAKSRGRKQAVPPMLPGKIPVVDLANVLEDAPVVWTLMEGPAAGTVNPDTGEYALTTQPGVYHLVATRKDDTKVSGTIEVVASAAPSSPVRDTLSPASFTIYPDRSLVEAGGEAYLKVTSGTVTWSLPEGATAGTLAVTGGGDQEVRFTAAGTPGVYSAIATSTVDTSQKAQASLEVGQRVSISVFPGVAPPIAPLSSTTLTALVGNTSTTGVSWDVVEGPSGGSITASGNSVTYTAPSTPGKFHVRATALADPNRSSQALVEVSGISPVSVQLLNPPTRVEIGTQTLMLASIFGSGNTGVIWTASAGTITAEGLWTAPQVLDSVAITATSVADPAKSASATITVSHLPRFTSLPPTSADVSLTPYSYVFSTVHPDGLLVSYTLEQGPTGAFLSGNTLSWTPTAAQAALTNVFILKAQDSLGGIARQQWTIEFRVTGTSKITFLWQDGALRSDNPTNFPLLGLTPKAHVPNGAGGYTTYSGVGLADGTFRIPNVPPGFYWLEVNSAFLWTSANRPILESLAGGRPDRVSIASLSPGSTLGATTFTGLAPWGATDDFVAYSPDTNLYLTPGFMLTTPPTLGATTVTGTWDIRADIFYNGPGLVEANKGDRFFFYQMGTQTAASGDPITVINRLGVPDPPVQMVGGAPFTLKVALAPVTGNSSNFRMVIDRGPWLGFASAVHPAAFLLPFAPMGVAIDTYPQFNPFSTESYIATGDVFFYMPTGSVPTSTFDSGQLSATDPWPAYWLRRWNVATNYRVQYLLPGTSIPSKQSAFISKKGMGLPTGSTDTTPSVLPCLSFQINGLNAQIDQTGVGLLPVLTWIPNPANTEAVTTYSARVFHLTASGSTTNATQVAVYTTTNPRIQLTPGLLMPGEAYFIRLTAGVPNQGSSAQILSGVFRP